MTPTNLAQHVASIETTHGMDLLADYVAWIESDGITVVAAVSGRRKSVVKKYHRVYTVLSAATVQAAIRDAGGCQVVCVWGLFIGICRSGRGRPQPFG